MTPSLNYTYVELLPAWDMGGEGWDARVSNDDRECEPFFVAIPGLNQEHSEDILREVHTRSPEAAVILNTALHHDAPIYIGNQVVTESERTRFAASLLHPASYPVTQPAFSMP